MEASTDLRSIDPRQRIHILDSLRGFALLGILLMNIPYFGFPEEVVSNLNFRNEYSGPNYYAWWIIDTFFEGSMRGLFSMMFGASMILFTTRLSKKAHIDSAAEIYYRRLIWMLLFGLVDAFIFLWPGDILYSYALCGLFLFPFRSLKPKLLFLIAGILLVLLTAKMTYQRSEPLRTKRAAEQVSKIDTTKTKLTEDQKDALQKWKGYQERQNLTTKKKEIDKAVRKTKGSYATLFAHYAVVNVYLETNDFYQSGFLDCLIFMIIGIGLYKLKVLTAERSTSFYLIMSIVGYLIAFPLIYWRLSTAVAARFDPIKMLEQIPVYTYEVRRLGLTLGHLGLLMLLYRSGIFSFVFNVWAKVGQMAFSNYLLQNIFCGTFFYGYGFNYFYELERYQLYYVVAGMWAINIIFSYLWLHYFRIGPFEWIWRSLTYWHAQPMRREA